MLDDELMYFNGIDAGSGGYSMPPIAPDTFSELVQGLSYDPARQQELQNFHQKQTAKHYGLKEDLDPKQLGQAGWGIVFPTEVDPAIVEALQPLIDWRREQVGKDNERLHKVFQAGDGFRPEDDKDSWLGRFNAHSGPVDPKNVPYYLLMVGSPDQIPFSFQNQVEAVV